MPCIYELVCFQATYQAYYAAIYHLFVFSFLLTLLLSGRWSFYFKNWKAWTCKVPLCGNWHIQWEETWRYCSFFSQLWCNFFVTLFLCSTYLSTDFILLRNFACIHCNTMPLQVPHVNRTDYQLIDISEDGFVSSNYIVTRYCFIYESLDQFLCLLLQ